MPTADTQFASARRREEERRLLERYHRDGDAAARAALVERFLPMARQLASRYRGGGESFDDLVQVACVGLLKAVDRFELDRTTAFTSFAVPTVLGELRRHFRDRGWALRVPRDLKEVALSVDRAADELAGRLGRSPTVEELAGHAGLSAEQVLEAREAVGAYRALSLDQPQQDDGEDRGIADGLGAEDTGFGRAEASATLAPLMDRLSERQREILRLRFEEDLTQSQIGARVGISQMHVSRLLREAVQDLREAATTAVDA